MSLKQLEFSDFIAGERKQTEQTQKKQIKTEEESQKEKGHSIFEAWQTTLRVEKDMNDTVKTKKINTGTVQNTFFWLKKKKKNIPLTILAFCNIKLLTLSKTTVFTQDSLVWNILGRY